MGKKDPRALTEIGRNCGNLEDVKLCPVYVL
jgi:hypothetical protein